MLEGHRERRLQAGQGDRPRARPGSRASSTRTASTSSRRGRRRSIRPEMVELWGPGRQVSRSSPSRTGWPRTTGTAGSCSPSGSATRSSSSATTSSSPTRAALDAGIESGVANSILIKVNQIGTLSPRRSRRSRWRARGLHCGHLAPLGETEDTFIADLAVGHRRRPDQDRLGAPHRPHREVQPVAAHRGGAGRRGGPCGRGGLKHSGQGGVVRLTNENTMAAARPPRRCRRRACSPRLRHVGARSSRPCRAARRPGATTFAEHAEPRQMTRRGGIRPTAGPMPAGRSAMWAEGWPASCTRRGQLARGRAGLRQAVAAAAGVRTCASPMATCGWGSATRRLAAASRRARVCRGRARTRPLRKRVAAGDRPPFPVGLAGFQQPDPVRSLCAGAEGAGRRGLVCPPELMRCSPSFAAAAGAQT